MTLVTPNVTIFFVSLMCNLMSCTAHAIYQRFMNGKIWSNIIEYPPIMLYHLNSLSHFSVTLIRNSLNKHNQYYISNIVLLGRHFIVQIQIKDYSGFYVEMSNIDDDAWYTYRRHTTKNGIDEHVFWNL